MLLVTTNPQLSHETLLLPAASRDARPTLSLIPSREVPAKQGIIIDSSLEGNGKRRENIKMYETYTRYMHIIRKYENCKQRHFLFTTLSRSNPQCSAGNCVPVSTFADALSLVHGAFCQSADFPQQPMGSAASTASSIDQFQGIHVNAV